MNLIIAKIGRRAKGVRQLARGAVVGLSSLAVVAACDFSGRDGPPAPGVVVPNRIQGFIGGAVADEPHAVMVARDILTIGGTAADAAVALYFTLAVTYPSTASLGGGGSCLVYKPGKKVGSDTTEVIEFVARGSRVEPRAGGWPSALPAAVRGMAALHARYGALRWANLLAPAEQLARFGFSISRAFAYDLKHAAGPLLDDRGGGQLFGNASGQPLGEGENITLRDLATVLAQLRLKGAGYFYTGDLAQRLVAAVEEAGGTLSMDELRALTPVWRSTTTLAFGDETLHTAPPPSEGGLTAARQFAALADADRYVNASTIERPHLVAEASIRAWGARGAPLDPAQIATLMSTYDPARHVSSLGKGAPWPTENPGGTSFVVVDRAGMAVTCTVTLNNLFGIGRAAPGLGIVLAVAPRGADPAVSFTPAMLVNHNTHQVLLAASASGGAAAPSALASVLRGLLIEKVPFAAALAAPRVHNSGRPDRTYVESRFKGGAAQILRARGHIQVEEVPELGLVSVIACLGGLPRSPETCVFASDPRGFGLGVGGVF